MLKNMLSDQIGLLHATDHMLLKLLLSIYVEIRKTKIFLGGGHTPNPP